jgi:hypothetical protein
MGHIMYILVQCSASHIVLKSRQDSVRFREIKKIIDMPPPLISQHDEAFEACVAALTPDIPLLMHGSGDVIPQNVDPASAALVARLTTDYITELCHAAIDAHDIWTDGAGGLLPPPPVEPKKLHPMPYSEEQKAKRRKPGVEYWDDPLPDPVIRGEPRPTPPKPSWVGLHGVDLEQTSRIRANHVQMAMDAQSFLFPIRHDAELYHRVTTLEEARNEIQKILEDSALTEFIQEEFMKQKEDDDVDELIEAEWPGLQSILPIHTHEESQ